MHIFQDENSNIRLQLMDLKHNKVLFDFTIEPSAYSEVRAHIIKHLIEYEPMITKSKDFFSETLREVLLAHHVYETNIDNAVMNDAVIQIMKYIEMK